MRGWIIALAIASAAFAGSTAYLAHQLSVERERAANSRPTAVAHSAFVATSPAAPAAAPESQARIHSAATKEARTATPGSVATGSQAISEADMKALRAEHSRRLLAQIADPQQREELVAQLKMHLRGQFPRVDQVLGLTPEEYSRFIELQAQQQIDLQESSARCSLDLQCSLHELHRGTQDSRAPELATLLGPERAQRFETYKNTLGEREAITTLRGRLPDALHLGDERAEQLIAALAQERAAIHREAMNNGLSMNGFAIGAGLVFAPGDGRPIDEQLAAARQNSQRLRERAAQYLNADQMRIFNEMQDETLLSLRSLLRNKELQKGFSAVTVTGGS